MALPFFYSGLLDNLGLQAFLGLHLFQASTLIIQHLQACHQRRIYATVLGLPFLERGAAVTVLSAQPRYGRTSLCSFENDEDLAVDKSGRLHAESSHVRTRENSTFEDH